MRSRFLFALLIACSGSPRRETPHAAPTPHARVVDAGVADAVIASEPDAADAPRTCDTYDERNPACRGSYRACVEGHADCKCIGTPDVENPACWAKMPCPAVPDPRVHACRPRIPSCTDAEAKNAPTLHCPPNAVKARVVKAEPRNGDTLITVAVGTNSVPKNWRATLLRGESDQPLPGGALTILRMSATQSVATVALPISTVRANRIVQFAPP